MIDLKPARDRMIDLLAGVAADRLSAPTPCADYSVGDLIDHVDGVSRGFAALARREAAPPAAGGGRPSAANLGDDWREGVTKHVWELGQAWDDPAAWRGSTDLGGLELPNERWGAIAFTEVVVHGWDLARATDQPFDLPESTLRACFDHVSGFVPTAPVEGLWGPAVEVPVDASLLDRLVAVTGRTP